MYVCMYNEAEAFDPFSLKRSAIIFCKKAIKRHAYDSEIST